MSTCSRCGNVFSCGMTDSDAAEPCWCTTLPALPADALLSSGDAFNAGSCFCPACLKAEIDSVHAKAGQHEERTEN